MPIKNLLVHLDQTKACPKRASAAVSLATRFEAHLTGLYCVGEFLLPGWADVPSHLLEEQRKREMERAESVLGDFGEKADRAGISHETRTAQVPADRLADEVALHARYSDLAILGQVDPEDVPTGGAHLVEQVVLGCGRPVLVIPYIGAQGDDGDLHIGRNVLAAWDASREATRAVNDALPFLEKAEKVEVVAVNPTKAARRHGEEPGADIALHLARHDVKVEVQHFSVSDIGPGDTLLSRLSDVGADMLVMGAYGHSRMREVILGGVTRTVLEHMTAPVLMSH